MKKNKIINLLIMVLFIMLLSSCGRIEATNNTINTKKIEVAPYTIESFQDALTVASLKAEQSVVAIIQNGAIKGSLGSAVVVKRIELKNEQQEIINYSYYAVTNYHVVRMKAQIGMKVYLSNQVDDTNYQSSDVEIVNYDEDLDLALVKFTSTIYVPTVEMIDSAHLVKGQMVLAVGTPMSLDYYNSVSHGIISHPFRYTEEDGVGNYYIQHDAPINPGNSGGGLFNIEGSLIGINTWRIISEKDQVSNISFSIPSSIVYNFIRKTINDYEYAK